MAFQNFLLNISISIISSQDVRNAIANKTKLFKKEIAKELNNNLLSIKINCVTCMNHTFIKIYIQYICNTKICLNILTIKKTYMQYIAVNII